DEATDPRSELVRQLVEYKKFKDAAGLLEAQAERQLCRLPRQPFELPAGPDRLQQPLRQVELWDLVSAFGRLMRETLALQPSQIVVDETPMHVYMNMIVERLKQVGLMPFKDFFTPPFTRARLVGLFLAVLELIRMGQIEAHQEDVFGQIMLRLVGG